MDFRTLTAAAGLVLLLNMASTDSRAKNPDSPDRTAWQKDLLDWRAKHTAELQKPDGWLSLAGLEWLEAGDNPFGGAADNKIHLADTRMAHKCSNLRHYSSCHYHRSKWRPPGHKL